MISEFQNHYDYCKELLNHIYKITADINVSERVAKIISYREDNSFVGRSIKLDIFHESFEELDTNARIKLKEILGKDSLSEVLQKETTQKICFVVQPHTNIYDKYTISLFPDKRFGRIYMTVADYELTENVISLMFKKNAVNINLSDIYYVDYGNHSVEIHTIQGQTGFFSVAFSDVADRLLKHRNFLRSYKNCIVNMDRIIKVDGDSFIMDNGDRISIPKRRHKEIIKSYENYQLEK